jgi:solute carrier family 45 protein 1/2/4
MPVEEGELSAKATMATLTNYLWTIIYMPNSLRMLCLTNLFCWMSLVCYSLYFTDFVGEAVFKGDPSVRADTYLSLTKKIIGVVSTETEI